MTTFEIPRWLPNIYIWSWQNKKTCSLFTKCTLLCAKTEIPQLHFLTMTTKPALNVPSWSIAIQVLALFTPGYSPGPQRPTLTSHSAFFFVLLGSSFAIASFFPYCLCESPWLPLSMVFQLWAHVFSRKVILMIFPGNLDHYTGRSLCIPGSSPIWILALLKWRVI